jgi:hypothetical protein
VKCTLPDAERLADHVGLLECWQAIEVQRSFFVAVLRDVAEHQALLDEAPATRGLPGRDT